jgi:D-arabinose 1-dehydrogenase-like Zn-dependent alcohol dehydrogenase
MIDSGYVAKLHPSAENKGFKVGDKIGMLYGVDCCYDCEGCQSHCLWCTKPKRGGAKLKGFAADGYFAEYATTDWQNAIILPENLPMDKISPLFCAGLTGMQIFIQSECSSMLLNSDRKYRSDGFTAFHSVDKCELQPGQWIAVIGCGGLGQFACRYAKAMGFKVVGLDINDDMLELVKQNGADVVINTKTTPKFGSQLRKATGGGCHAAAVFSAALPAYATARSALRVNGVLMVVGLPDKPLSFPAFGISGNLFRIKGANTGTPMEMKKGVDFTAKHQILPEVVYRKLEEMPQMWDELEQGKASKRMVVLFQ